MTSRSPSPSPTTPTLAAVPGSLENDGVFIPDPGLLMRTRNLQALADQLRVSTDLLTRKVAVMEKRIRAPISSGLLPFQIRRAQEEKENLEKEKNVTQRTVARLALMSEQVRDAMALKEKVHGETRDSLMAEIAAVEQQIESHKEPIRRGYIERINMLQRYWPWRQLKELGDTKVGRTFEEELKRGPRYRNVGMQNNIQSDYISQQLHWLQQFGSKELVFQNHLRRLEVMVEDLNDITELLETAMTCSICGLIYERPVLFWSCGHSFCHECFDSLAIARNLYRCPTCGAIDSEGYLHNLLLSETIAKWMFKDSGYGDIQTPLSAIRIHLACFRQDDITRRIRQLKEEIRHAEKTAVKSKGTDPNTINISYRLY